MIGEYLRSKEVMTSDLHNNTREYLHRKIFLGQNLFKIPLEKPRMPGKTQNGRWLVESAPAPSENTRDVTNKMAAPTEIPKKFSTS